MTETPKDIRAKLLEKLGGVSKSGGNATISTYSILKNLDQQFVSRYIMKLEDAGNLLRSYLDELQSLNDRMSKVSPVVRKSMGGRDVDAKSEAIQSTLKKLSAHQTATIDRLMG